MNIVEIHKNLKNCFFSIVKITFSVLIILICLFRKKLFNIEMKWVNILLSILCFFTVVACVICIYISTYEIFKLFELNNSRCKDIRNAQKIPIEKVIQLLNNNDIIEIEIIYDEGVLSIGSSSDCKNGSNIFFDKKYFWGKCEFDTIEDFYNYLVQHVTDDYLYVISIDGIVMKNN